MNIVIHVSIETHFTQRCYDLYILFLENPHSGYICLDSLYCCAHSHKSIIKTNICFIRIHFLMKNEVYSDGQQHVFFNNKNLVNTILNKKDC